MNEYRLLVMGSFTELHRQNVFAKAFACLTLQHIVGSANNYNIRLQYRFMTFYFTLRFSSITQSDVLVLPE